MNILIVGANGLLGIDLTAILSKNHKIYALVRDKNKIKFNLNKNIKDIELDLYDCDLSKLPTNIDCIYYLAQSNKFRDFPNSYEDIVSININSPLKFANWARINNVKKFFYTSSGGVYKNPKQPVSEFLDIDANVKNGFYLDSKLSSEILLKNYANFFETFIIFRPFFMYGEKQKSDMLIPRLINNVQNSKPIILNGKNGIKVNPIYVSDAANACASALDIENGEYIFNIAGNEVFSLKEICEHIGKILQKEVIYDIEEENQNDLIAEIKLMEEKLFIPKISLREGLRKLIKRNSQYEYKKR